MIRVQQDGHRLGTDFAHRSTVRSFLVEQKFFTKPISEKDTHHLHQLGKKDVVWHFLKESLARRLAHRRWGRI